MSTIGIRIQARRKELGMTQEELAEKMGYKSKSSINKIELGVNDIPQSKILLFAQALMTSPAYLMGWDEADDGIYLPATARPAKRKRLPLLGNVACGEPIFATEEHDTFVDTAEDLDADFCLVARGDSMINARIFDGDILFVKSQEMVNNGEIAVVLIGDEATVKRVYYDRENNTVALAPENPTHKVMRYSGSELNNIRIIGRVLLGQYKIV